MSIYRLTSEEEAEIYKCIGDFTYFCETYLNLTLFPYQERLYDFVEENQYIILSKFRKGGFTTLMVAYALWKCLFFMNQKIVYCSEYNSRDLFDLYWEMLPKWLKGKKRDFSFLDTNSIIAFINPVMTAEWQYGVTCVIMDEIAKAKSTVFWKDIQVALFAAKCIIQSTPDSSVCWFNQALTNAKAEISPFKFFVTDYKEHPVYKQQIWKDNFLSDKTYQEWQNQYEQLPTDYCSKKKYTSSSIYDDINNECYPFE